MSSKQTIVEVREKTTLTATNNANKVEPCPSCGRFANGHFPSTSSSDTETKAKTNIFSSLFK